MRVVDFTDGEFYPLFLALRASRLPVHALDLVSKNHARSWKVERGQSLTLHSRHRKDGKGSVLDFALEAPKIADVARPLRLEYAGALYHLTARGNARADIFADDEDRHLFLELLGKEISQQGWRCYAYCLMSKFQGQTTVFDL